MAEPPVILLPKKRALVEGAEVLRVLPQARCRSVGPFVFLDHFGPKLIEPEAEIDVLPHPHIHLATVSYLFAGAWVHRDSLGTEQILTPGGINFMTAGRGIVHSERRRPEDKTTAFLMHGVQLWVALPEAAEEMDPSFQHLSLAEVPTSVDGSVQISVLLGKYQNLVSAMVTQSPMCLLSITTETACELTLPHEDWERALYLVNGKVELDQTPIEAPALLVVPIGNMRVRLGAEARLLFLAGPHLEKPRFMEWNFISSRREAIEEAKIAWKERRFPLIPGDAQERVDGPDYD